MKTPGEIPEHLQRYVVEQDYSKYTAIDQAVWRYIMGQLKNFLSQAAHPCYLEGLEKTGISSESIPKIEEMNVCLSRYGWKAVPVSGFIPPAAFMELQALGILPIASDVRTLDHLHYTPAPDIVHEAAGHAPILIDPEFSSYLRKYALVAKKAIISKKDLDLYEAIRELSDIKEHPNATQSQIDKANENLEEAKRNYGAPSEAAILGRMNWWTAEYGLVGPLAAPKIFGAGLLSSVGESREVFSDKVKKIPFSLECIDFNYDITEPQPQLFVTPDFKTLEAAIDQLSLKMAFKQGGLSGLRKALDSQTVNTVQLNSGVQISGELSEILESHGQPIYLRFKGPCQLCASDSQLPHQGVMQHPLGFGAPVGLLKGEKKCLSEMDPKEIARIGFVEGKNVNFSFESGIALSGRVKKLTFADGKLAVVTFENCKVEMPGQVLFDPSWGDFDLAVGSEVVSVFGGPADRRKFLVKDDFVVKKVEKPQVSPEQKELIDMYAIVRQIRHSIWRHEVHFMQLVDIVMKLDLSYPQDWLLRLEIFELLEKKAPESPLCLSIEKKLLLFQHDKRIGPLVKDGLKLISLS